jgi:hypothetical protein
MTPSDVAACEPASRVTALHARILIGTIGCLALVFVVEWLPSWSSTPVPPAPKRIAALNRTDTRLVARDTEAWASAILARPLFSISRRPPKVAAGRNAAVDGMPRLSGIMIAPGIRKAIFAPEGGGKPVVLGEGATLADTSIRTIEPGEVILASGQVLRPMYDKNRVPGQPAYTPAGLPTPAFNNPNFANPAFQPPGFQPPGFQPPGFQPPGFQPPGFQPPGLQQQGVPQPPFQPAAAAGDGNESPPPPPFRGVMPQRRE